VDNLIRRILLTSCLFATTSVWAVGGFVLSGATVFDGNGGPPIADGSIRVENDRIQCVGSRSDCPAVPGDREIDLSGQFVTPGLVDAHVHFMQTGWLDGRPHQQYLSDYYDYEALQAGLKASQDRWHRAYLCSGVTAVFDPGGLPWTPSYEKAAEGNPKRAHYRGSGPLITHAQISLGALGGETFLSMDSDEAVAEGVDRLVEWGARAVKVWYLDPPADRREELDARLILVGELARARDLPLIVHATELRNAKAALRAGASLLVHSVTDKPVDEEFIEMAKKAGVVYTPTLQVHGNWSRALATVGLGITTTPDDPNACIDAETRRVIAHAGDLNESAPDSLKSLEGIFQGLEKAGQDLRIMMDNLNRLFEAGITVATATDAGNPLTFHGPAIYREMEIMQAAGIPPEAIIRLSTRNGAQVMDMSKEIGTLEPGKIADLIVLSEDPSKDVSAFRSVHHVMHLGHYFSIKEFAATDL
jgi:imidazolonepropionase-like amidohydrolase